MEDVFTVDGWWYVFERGNSSPMAAFHSRGLADAFASILKSGGQDVWIAQPDGVEAEPAPVEIPARPKESEDDRKRRAIQFIREGLQDERRSIAGEGRAIYQPASRECHPSRI